MQKPFRPYMLMVDVQDTLIDVPDEAAMHLASLEHGIRSVIGIDVQVGYLRDGKTDYTIIRDAMNQIGLDSMLTNETFDKIVELAFEHYARICPADLESFLLPGVTSALLRLKAFSDVKVVPFSGASKQQVDLIASRAKINNLLEIGYGAYGDWDIERKDLITSARRRAGGLGPWDWPSDRVIFVSSSAKDVQIVSSRSPETICIGIDSARFSAQYGTPSFAYVPNLLVANKIVSDQRI